MKMERKMKNENRIKYYFITIPVVNNIFMSLLLRGPNILRQAVTVASVKTLEKPEYQANDSGTKSTIFGSNRAAC